MTGNNNDDRESFSEWLFHERKLRRRNKRHTTRTATTKKETDK